MVSPFTRLDTPRYGGWRPRPYCQVAHVNAETYSGELRLSPRVVRSIPGARATRFGSFSAARMNVSSPTMPNWSITMPCGMFDTVPAKHVSQSTYYRSHPRRIGNALPACLTLASYELTVVARRLHIVGSSLHSNPPRKAAPLSLGCEQGSELSSTDRPGRFECARAGSDSPPSLPACTTPPHPTP